MTIAGLAYHVESIFLRTKGSRNQKLFLHGHESKHTEVETRTKFYLLTRRGNNYFAKWDSRENLVSREYERGMRVQNHCVVMSGVSVRPVQYVAQDGLYVITKYLPHHRTWRTASMAPESKLKAKEAIIRWLETSGLKRYDLSVNNVMVRHENNELDIQLIDFADASKTIEDCLSDIKNWS